MAAAIGTAIVAGLVSGSTIAAGIGFSLSAFATSLALGVVGRALSPKPKAAPNLAYDGGSRTQSIRQPIAPRRVVFGTDRVGGVITFSYDDSPAQCTGILYTFTGHRVKAIREVFFNDEAVPHAADGWNVTGRYNGNVGMEKALGTESGQPLPNLQTHSAGQWTARHKQTGCAKTYIRMRRVRELFTSGIPNVTALIDGYDQVYDPRTATNVFTSNPALLLACYLTTPAFWKDAGAWATIDETALIAAANICDERISQVYQPAFTVTAASDTITFAAAQTQIKTGDCVKYVSTSGAAGGLTSGEWYYYISTGSATGKLATTRANALAGIAIDLTSAGSGTQTLERMPAVTANPDTDRLTFEAEEFRLHRGDGVRVEASGSLPTGLSGGTTYYVIPVTATEIQLATSYANAFAGTAINITAAGSGVHLKPYDEVRYACNGSFTLDQQPQDIIEQIAATMSSRAPQKVGGTWRIVAGAYTAPTDTLTEGEMDGPRSVQVMTGRAESANGCKGVFVGPENFYQSTDFVPVTDATYLTEDNGERVWKEAQWTMVRRHSLARRLAKRTLVRIREGLTVTLQCQLKAYRFQIGDIIGVTVDRYGWSSKAFEVLNVKLVVRGDGDNIRLGVDLLVQAISSAADDWSASENAAATIIRNTSLPDPFQVASQRPPRVAGLEIFGQGSDTEFTGRDCKFVWRRSSVTGAYDIGAEPDAAGAGAGQVDWFVDGYVVRIYKTDGTLLRTEPLVRDPVYIYTFEKNFEDTAGSPVRAFVIKVWAHTRYGLESLYPAQLSVSNPAPSAVTPTVTATIKGLKFHFDIPAISDFNGFKIYGSTVDGFTANASTLIYDGVDNESTLGTLTKGDTYYYRYLTKDTFGDGTISAQASATAGLYAVASDLLDGAISELSYSSDATGISFSPSLPIAALVSAGFDVENPGPVWAQAQVDVQVSGGATHFDGTIVLSPIDVKSRYTTGTIVSAVGTTVTGSGTSWLSAGLQAGDILYFGVGKPQLAILSVTDDTHLEVVSAVAHSGSYIIFKGVVGVTSSGASKNAYFGDTNRHQLGLFVTTVDTPTDPLYTERIFILTCSGSSNTLTLRDIVVQVFHRKK